MPEVLEVTANPRSGHLRWTICAMLFVATSINYMDRQVIGILKPTLQHSIGLTELNFGYIGAAFQAAYAIGLLVAGRLVDRLGSRVGHTFVMGTWGAVGSIVGIGGMAGSVGGVRLSVSSGKILQFTHNYTSLFVVAGSAYLLAIAVLRTLAPNLRRVNFQSVVTH